MIYQHDLFDENETETSLSDITEVHLFNPNTGNRLNPGTLDTPAELRLPLKNEATNNQVYKVCVSYKPEKIC